MSFSKPRFPTPEAPPPPPPPPLLANANVQMSGQQARRAAAAASGSGFAGTIRTTPQGADDSTVAVAKLGGKGTETDDDGADQGRLTGAKQKLGE